MATRVNNIFSRVVWNWSMTSKATTRVVRSRTKCASQPRRRIMLAGAARDEIEPPYAASPVELAEKELAWQRDVP